MRFARWIVAVAIATVIGTTARDGRAFCGFYVAGADAKLFNNATMVVMMRDGTRTVLAMQNNYQGPPEKFAMIVPVPVVLQKENVRTLERAVFDHVDQMAAPRLVEYWEQDPCAEAERSFPKGRAMNSPAPMAAAAEQKAADLGVKIEAQFAVGEYEIVILSANDSLGLDTWLRQEKYKIPDGAEPLLRPYVAAGSKFFVAKVDPEKVKFEKGMATLSPLRFHYDTESFNLPVRLGLINSAGTQDLIVHVLARRQRYDVANYPNVTIPTNFDVAERARDEFGTFYAALFDKTVEANPRAVVTEYSWQATSCDPCPGPTLTPGDLVTLGADVLPSVMEEPPMPMTQVTLPPGVQGPQYALQWQLQSRVQPCYQAALRQNRSAKGKFRLRFASGGAPELEPDGDFPSGELAACIQHAATDAAKQIQPPLGALPGPVTVSLQSTPSWNVFSDFVLTRLHARYGKDALGEDLVFKKAEPIIGGREIRDHSGRLETAAQPSSMNNFQARYAIRHRWEGPATCANAKFGVWGPPPRNEKQPMQSPPQPKAARDTAFAPRGGVKLASFVAEEVPGLGIKPETKSRGCGCRTAGTGGGVDAGVIATVVAALGARMARRRRSRAKAA